MSKTKTMTKTRIFNNLTCNSQTKQFTFLDNFFGTIYMGDASSLGRNLYFCCPVFYPRNLVLPARISPKNPFLLGGPNCLFLLLPPCISTFHICSPTHAALWGSCDMRVFEVTKLYNQFFCRFSSVVY